MLALILLFCGHLVRMLGIVLLAHVSSSQINSERAQLSKNILNNRRHSQFSDLSDLRRSRSLVCSFPFSRGVTSSHPNIYTLSPSLLMRMTTVSVYTCFLRCGSRASIPACRLQIASFKYDDSPNPSQWFLSVVPRILHEQ